MYNFFVFSEEVARKTVRAFRKYALVKCYVGGTTHEKIF